MAEWFILFNLFLEGGYIILYRPNNSTVYVDR